jgi:hypothetical protein
MIFNHGKKERELQVSAWNPSAPSAGLPRSSIRNERAKGQSSTISATRLVVAPQKLPRARKDCLCRGEPQERGGNPLACAARRAFGDRSIQASDQTPREPIIQRSSRGQTGSLEQHPLAAPSTLSQKPNWHRRERSLRLQAAGAGETVGLGGEDWRATQRLTSDERKHA